MNWAKGLFRIWIIISALWIVPFFLIHDPVSNFERMNRLEAELGDDRGLISIERIERALSNAEEVGNQDDINALRRMINESWNGVYRTQERRYYDSAKSALKYVLQIIFIPPAVLGFILFGIWWIAGGFSARKRD